MVAFRSSSAAAVLGAVAFQAVSILLPRAASASWGWTLAVPAGAKFTCAEGTPIGCAIPVAGCSTSNVTCTVQPATGFMCNETSIAVHCILPGGTAFLPYATDTDGGSCKSSSNNTLFWSAVPACTNGSSSVTSSNSVSSASSNSSNSSSSSTQKTSISGASQAAVSAPTDNSRPVQLRTPVTPVIPLGPVVPTSSYSDLPWDYIPPWEQNYPLCGGRAQSPVNIDTNAISSSVSTLDPDLLKLDYPYGPNPLELENNLEKEELTVEYEAGRVTYNGALYKSKNFHFHWSSEHTIDGKNFTGEMHVVHQKSGSSGNADILVIAVFFEIGSASNFLMSLGLPGGEPFPVIGAPLTLDSELLLAMADGLYMYSGSLTTPPCSETVTWVVLAKPRTASQVQIDEAQNYYPEPANHRPLQPLNGRKIGKNMFPVTSPASWCKDFDLSLLDKSSKADCKKQQQKAYYENHGLWEQRSRAVSGKRIADISISSVMFLLLGILGATSLVAWRRGAWSRPAPLSDPGDGFLLSETDGFLSSDELVA